MTGTVFHDLTYPLSAGMPVYPGDPQVEVDEVLTIPADGCSVRSVHLGTHSGTHLDAPAHVIPDGRTVDRVLPGELTGPAAVLQPPDLVPGQRIDAAMLAAAWGETGGYPPVVLVATGWDRYWGTDDYQRHPVLTTDAASALVAVGVHVIGVDTASPDGADDLAVHRIILGADHLIIENLRGLTELPAVAEFTALPLPVAGADGALVRAVAMS